MAKILIIDDDPIYSDMTRQRLERAGHEVTLHSGPRGATVAARKPGIDLILLDVFMPALCGPELLDLMRQNHREPIAKVIFSSSMDADPLRALAEQHKAHGSIPKSAARGELLSLVEAVLKPGETLPKSPPG
jgi:CheY-like chemotaxis protein